MTPRRTFDRDGAVCTVLIGIPSFRRPEGIRRLLQSLARQTGIEGVNVTVFVADNDPHRQEARRVCANEVSQFGDSLRCQVVEERGVAAARNRILDEARASGVDYVAMLDDDQIATPDWLSQLLAMQQGTGADAVGGRVIYRFPIEPSASVRRWGYFNPRRQRPGFVPMLTGAGNALLSCASLNCLNWPMFDVRFGASGGEDAEFFGRMANAAFRFAWAPEAIVYEEVEPDRLAERALLSRAFRTGNNEVRIRRVNGQTAAMIKTIAKATVILCAAPLFAPLLLTPWRLWLLSKWASSAGRMAGLLGRTTAYYGAAGVGRSEVSRKGE